MDVEKIVNSKLYNVFNTLYKILIINFITMILSLFIVTIIPSFSAAFKTIKDSSESKDKGLLKTYFTNWIDNFKIKFFVGLIILGILAIFAFAIYFYISVFNGESFVMNFMGVLYTIGFYLILFCVGILLLVTIQVPAVLSYFHFRIFDVLKFSIYMAMRNFFQTLIIACCWAISIISIFYITWVFMLIGIAGPIYIAYIISRKKYWYLLENNLRKTKDIEEDNKYELEGNEDDKIRN